MEDFELQQILEIFLREKYHDQLLDAARRENGFVAIDFRDLDMFNPDVADSLLYHPDRCLKLFNAAVAVIDLPTRSKINIRIKNIPDSRKFRIRNLRAEHVERFVALEGVVRRATEVRPQISEAVFECPRCGAKITTPQAGNTMKRPAYCECGYKGKMEMVDRTLFDARWVTVEEPFEVAEGDKPSELNVYLRDDLTIPEMQKKTDPGSKLLLTGILRELPKSVKGKRSTTLDIFLEVNHVEPQDIGFGDLEISEEDLVEIHKMAADPNIHEKLVASIAPSIYGMTDVKEAIVLQLFGGTHHTLSDGSRIRGDIHVLLVGDPSAGKSQMLKLVSTVMPRGRYVSGTGASGAGLTATVSKDEMLGGWVLEAGALVMTNKSLISIDEFDKMNRDDVVAMHEAMEQGTISIAKASIVATLPSHTSILAGANPKLGRFDPYKAIAEQINIPETLLSRFDLKFALRDRADPENDARITTHILERGRAEKIRPIIDTQLLRKYIAYARSNIKPQMTEDAKEEIKKFYLEMRGMYRNSQDSQNTIAIATRQLEALIRLSEAACKVRLGNEVNADDARRAINVMKSSLRQLGYDPETGRYDIDRTEGMPSSQRNKIRKVQDIIETLEREMGKNIRMEDVMSAATEQGVMNADEIIRKMKQDGMLFEPKPGYIQKI
jgi:replicative DNA helicase Mcm